MYGSCAPPIRRLEDNVALACGGWAPWLWPALISSVRSNLDWCRGVTLFLCDMAMEDEES